MANQVWILVATGGKDDDVAVRVAEMTQRIAGARPDVTVRGVVFGRDPGVGPVLKTLEDAGYTEAVLIPLWFALPEDGAADVDRFFRRIQELRTGMTITVAPPLGLQRGVEEAVMEAAGQAVPLAEAALPATIPALERRKRRTAKPPAFERLVMVCTGANCLGGGSWELSEQIPATLQASKTKGVRVLRTACLGPCPAAPVVHVLPDDVWYGGITQEDGLRIAREHLAGGEPCDDLRLKTRQPRVRKAKPITAP